MDLGHVLAPELAKGDRDGGMCSSARRMKGLEDSRDVETENSQSGMANLKRCLVCQ